MFPLWLPLLCWYGLNNLRAQVLVNLDFEGANDFTDNFRFSHNPSTVTTVQSSNGAGNDYVSTLSGTAVENETFIYDTTPADATVKNTFSGPLRIEADIRSVTGNSSFGIYIVNSGNEGGAVHTLALSISIPQV